MISLYITRDILQSYPLYDGMLDYWLTISNENDFYDSWCNIMEFHSTLVLIFRLSCSNLISDDTDFPNYYYYCLDFDHNYNVFFSKYRNM